MNETKDIQDFFSITLLDLTVNTTIPFTLYLYLEKNNHILTWKLSGEFISDVLLENAERKKINKIWIHKNEKQAFEKYKAENNSSEEAADDPELLALLESENIDPTPSPLEQEETSTHSKTKEGEALREVIRTPEIPEEEKKEILSQFGHELIQEALSAKNESDLKKSKIKAKFIVQDLLLESSMDSLRIAQELWKISDTFPDLTHSINVSTYAVVFAMAFGRIENEVLSDIALAGLLHDCGTTQIPFQISKKPWSELTKEEKLIYFQHPVHSMFFIEKNLPAVSERVLKLIHQQHEQFNGQGYPEHIKGFEFDDLAQILSLAEVFESFSNSQWDGTTRSMKESFELLDQLEKEKNFPQFFNPDIFAVVLQWLKSQIEKDKLQTATTTVSKQSANFMKNAA